MIDSSSSDETLAVAQGYGVDVVSIPRSSFNHGTTRERGRRVLGCDIVVMMTPDAYPRKGMLEKLIAPLLEGRAELSYARQVARSSASLFEAFPRAYNYPRSSHIRSQQDVKEWGVYSFFLSDSCAAYRNGVLDELGGFPEVLTAEDALVAAKALLAGYRIAYVAEAVVEHSHRYSLWQELTRHFDTGYMRRQYRPLFSSFGSDQRRGRSFVNTFLKRVVQEKPYLLPYAMVHIGAKFMGYWLGSHSLKSPLWWKRALSMQRHFWT